MQKIVALLRVKDGNLFVDEWLRNMDKLVDEIVVVDNGSTDGTYEILTAHPKVVDIQRTQGFDEGRDKILLYELARKRNPDWCLWLDVDEIFEDAMTKEVLQKLTNQKSITQYFFRRFHFVDSKHFNFDWKWIKITSGYDRILWREQSSGYFDNSKFNNGLIKGITGKRRLSHYRLKHLGYINSNEVEKKVRIYRSVDPNMEDTYQSMIFNKPRQIKWKEYKGVSKMRVTSLNLFFDIIFLARFIIRKVKKNYK